MPWVPRVQKPVPSASSETKEIELNDYSKGINNYVANDVVRDEYWELAQNARIPALGEYETRKGCDFHSDAVGETEDQTQTSTTGAADQPFSNTVRLAQKFTAGTTGRLSKVEVRLKNDASATGTAMVEIYSDSSGSPGTLMARSSIASSAITSSYAYITARFISAPQVAASTAYWIVVYSQTVATGSYKWSSTTTATTAKSSSDSGSTWSATSYALNFKQHYATDAAPKGLVRAYKSDGTAKTIFAAGTVIYSVADATGTLTSVKTGLSSSATKYRFCTVNDILYYVNGFDGIRKLSGASFGTDAQVSATNATLVCEHKGMLFFADKNDPNKLFFSNFASYETFTSTDFIYVPSPKTGDPITAMASLNGNLVIWTRNRKYVLYGSNNANFLLEEAPGKKGTYSQETVATDRNFAYFLADDGVYRFNGTIDELISKDVYETIRSLPNKPTATLGLNRGRLYLFSSAAAEAFNSFCWVFNLNFGSVESYDTGAYVSRFVTAFNDSDSILVASSLIGQVYWQELSSNDHTNLGDNIDFYLQTHYMVFGSPAKEKEIRYWKPRFAAQSGNYAIHCQYGHGLRDSLTTNSSVNMQGAGTLWGSGIWGSFTWGTAAERQSDLKVPGQYRRIQIAYKHFATRQPHKFLGHTFSVQIRRLR